MKKIAIVGAGGFGREVLMLIEQINKNVHTWEPVGFYDDNKRINENINGFKVLGKINDLEKINYKLHIVLAIGDPKTKKIIRENINNSNIVYATLIHPSVILEKTQFVEISEGTIIACGTNITTNIIIGKHVILNLNCTVGHDTNIGDYCSFMPSVNISGNVKIDECVFMGTNSCIVNDLTIERNTIVGAGAVVSKSLPASCTAVGIPARPIKFHK